jgi:hypothetical protein
VRARRPQIAHIRGHRFHGGGGFHRRSIVRRDVRDRVPVIIITYRVAKYVRHLFSDDDDDSENEEKKKKTTQTQKIDLRENGPPYFETIRLSMIQ